MALYAALFTYVVDQERVEAVRPDHRAYLRSLLDAGSLHEAGRFGHERGGLIVYNTENEEEAQALFDRDPFTTGGIIELDSLQEWKVILSAWE